MPVRSQVLIAGDDFIIAGYNHSGVLYRWWLAGPSGLMESGFTIWDANYKLSQITMIIETLDPESHDVALDKSIIGWAGFYFHSGR